MTNDYNTPPAIKLLLDECGQGFSSTSDFERHYKKIAKEISVQAEWSYEHFDYFDDGSPRQGPLVITASGGLNPFSEHDLCSNPRCRIKSTREIARTLGLYGDVVVIPDSISCVLADIKKPSASQLRWIANQLLVLKELEPLIEAGIVQFWSGKMAVCSGCASTMERQIEQGVSELREELDHYVHVELYDDHMAISTTGLLESPTVLMRRLTRGDKKKLKTGTSAHDLAKKYYAEVIEDRVRSTLYEMSFARWNSSLLMSTSRSELYALRSFDEKAPALNDLAVWEQARSVQLPWVNELSVQQIVQLRQEAATALPSFRETFVRHIASPKADIESVANKISDLRESAANVERELKALNPAGEKAFRNVAGALGITVSVYGFAAGFAAPGLALSGLVTLLGLVHSSARHDQEKETVLESQPGYVLLKAKELSEHASE